MPSPPLLRFEQVSKFYPEDQNQLHVLNQISLELLAGQSIALMGASGSGKSTLLHLAAGLDQPTSGAVLLQGESLNALPDKQLALLRRKKLGFVFQQFNLLPGISVEENILFQSRLNRQTPDPDWLAHLLDQLEIGDLLHRQNEQLSGGQQQRVAIARALAHRPQLVLADEPTGNLHDELSHQVMALFTKLCADNQSALLLVTHSQAMASYLNTQLTLKSGALYGAV